MRLRSEVIDGHREQVRKRRHEFFRAYGPMIGTAVGIALAALFGFIVI